MEMCGRINNFLKQSSLINLKLIVENNLES